MTRFIERETLSSAGLYRRTDAQDPWGKFSFICDEKGLGGTTIQRGRSKQWDVFLE
jgi:hypothetical protein